ncbi:MAG TPA: Fic family protein [Microthrixaceae bacterium]|nr:Fic family protein [Microthrixaceae bacterium]
MSRRALRRVRGPYEAAVVPCVASASVALSSPVAAAVDDAAAEVARFDAELGHEIAPFAAVLLRSESAASSKIENLTASARAIAEAELNPRGGRNASLIVANERAMIAAIAMAEQIDQDAILEMHAALLGQSAPDIAGRWRDQQVWIGGGDLGPHDAMFVPPHHERVEAAVADLVTFIERDDIPVLAHAALAHAQFETIHPFPDGNGRVGRALVHAHLRSKGLTRSVTVPVSAGLLTDTDTYFEALTSYRDGDVAPIVEAFATAALRATTNARQLVADLHAARDDWQTRIKARRHANAWRAADVLFRHPVVNAALVADELGIEPTNSYRVLRPLVDAGVIVEFTDRTRDRLWRAPDVLTALDQFAARAGRRNRPTH